VKRNRERFPEDFMFRLIVSETAEVITNCDHLHQHGAIMAAMVLNSPSPPVPSSFEGGREHLTWTPPPIAGEDEGGGIF
jgi:hypothetical protein